MAEGPPAVGIDLGTTYSCVAVFQHGKVEIIANDQGNRTTPSYVAFTDAERLIGEAAKNQAAGNPENTIFDAKRLIGRKYTDATVQEDMKLWPFKVIKSGDGTNIEVKYKGENKQFYPQEISAMVLEKMKETAEEYLGRSVHSAVVTVPAYFNDAQRSATQLAGKICGLNILQVLNEPTAAAVAYGFDKKLQEENNVLVFDFGGGTLDVSILTIKGGVFRVRATAGNTHLGGEDLDNIMMKRFADEFKRKHRKDISTNKRAMCRLRSACESAKRNLSSAKLTNIDVDSLCEGIDFHSTISRARFEDMIANLIPQILEPIKRALADAELDKTKINEIVLVGGSTRIPKVQEVVKEFFNGKELNKSINPDEAVAYGACVQAAALKGVKCNDIKDMVLLDVTPLSLGMETSGGVMTAFIKRNTPIPTQVTKFFSTSVDNQSTVEIKVYEGERTMVNDNNLLGTFELSGIPPAPRRTPKIEVTFSIDVNGILNVKAVEKSTGKEGWIVITNDKGRLSTEEILRLIEEAEKFKIEDVRRKETIESRIALESYCYNLKSSVEDKGLNKYFSGIERMTIVSKCDEILRWIEVDQFANKDDLDRKLRELQSVCNPIMKGVYENVAKGPEGRPNLHEVD